eukprot:CAMPEP_0175129934 /NCGR_PEP_ID=MMETSP0087-20121206/5740_1 /TAXON_ID=136419 /ORGANISM="Unknown Unknown, Strain D1" /LENGTH=292 /DNA_ID=CAMNT_0016412123 /DNA_START=90 /DNA_END=968 /DNA_ORIENTATION=+
MSSVSKIREDAAFSMQGVALRPEDVNIIAGAIENDTKLQTLKLSQVGLVDSGVSSLVSAISSHPALKKLCLDDNQFSQIGIRALCTLIAKNTPLAVLSITQNNIGPADLLLLVEALNWNDNIQEFVICGNAIGDEGVTVLINTLKCPRKKGLCLCLRNNNITDAGAQMVGSWFASGKCPLEEIMLCRNPRITDTGREELERVMTANGYERARKGDLAFQAVSSRPLNNAAGTEVTSTQANSTANPSTNNSSISTTSSNTAIPLWTISAVGLVLIGAVIWFSNSSTKDAKDID